MPWRVLSALLLMALGSLMEGVGLLLLVPLLDIIGLDVPPGNLGQISRFLFGIFNRLGLPPTLITVLAVFVAVFVARGLVLRWQTLAGSRLRHEFVAILRNRLYRAITRTNWVFFSRSASSGFAQLLTMEAFRAGDAAGHLLRLAATVILSAIYLAFALKFSLEVTLVVVACGAALLLVLRGKTVAARRVGQEVSEAVKELFAAVTEHLGGMKIARVYRMEERHTAFFHRLTGQVRQVHGESARHQADARLWFDVGSITALAVVLYLSLEVLRVGATEVLLVVFLFARLMPLFSRLQQSYQGLVNLLPAFQAIADMQARCAAAAEPRSPRSGPLVFRHHLRLRGVSFGYRQDQAVRDLDLEVRAGETTALVGQSGAGKSTVADLITGLLRPDRGVIEVDGVPLAPENLDSWRELIGYVTQDTYLLHDTIRANLLWASPGALQGEINRALEMSSAGELVRGLPDGLDTVVGDRGMQLSGGERQRLALARALLRRPVLLILDEATSALDSANEERILETLEGLHGAVTMLVISHRLSAVRRADNIYVMERGRVVERGDWESLTTRAGGKFHALVETQRTATGPSTANGKTEPTEVRPGYWLP